MDGQAQGRDQSDLAKICSIIAALVMASMVLVGLRLYVIGGVIAGASAWGFAVNLNPRQAPSRRLLALVLQVIGLLAVLAVFYLAMMFAEGGRRGYDVIPGWATLVMLAIVGALGIATKDGLDAYRGDSD